MKILLCIKIALIWYTWQFWPDGTPNDKNPSGGGGGSEKKSFRPQRRGLRRGLCSDPEEESPSPSNCVTLFACKLLPEQGFDIRVFVACGKQVLREAAIWECFVQKILLLVCVFLQAQMPSFPTHNPRVTGPSKPVRSCAVARNECGT